MNYSLYRAERERDMGTIHNCGLDEEKQLNGAKQCWSRRRGDGDDTTTLRGGRKI